MTVDYTSYKITSTDLGVINLGIIRRETYRQTTEMDIIGYPASSSKDTTAEDYSGVVQTITIEGVFYGTNTVTLMTFVSNMNQLQNGFQNTVIFYSDLWKQGGLPPYANGNFNVKIRDFTWEYGEADSNIITYSLTLIESA